MLPGKRTDNGSQPDAKSASTTPSKPKGYLNNDKIDAGRQKGLYDTKKIRETVLKWQIFGAESTTSSNNDNEACYDSNDLKARVEDGSSSAPRQSEPTSTDKSTVQAYAKEEMVAEQSELDELADVVADEPLHLTPATKIVSPTKLPPKKRVISDEHWLMMRKAPEKKAISPPKLKTPAVKVEHDFKDGAWVRRKIVTDMPRPPAVKKAADIPLLVRRKQPRPNTNAAEDELRKGLTRGKSEEAGISPQPLRATKTILADALNAKKSPILEERTPPAKKLSPLGKGNDNELKQEALPKKLPPKLIVEDHKNVINVLYPFSSLHPGPLKLPEPRPRTDRDEVEKKEIEAIPQINVNSRVHSWINGTSDPFIDAERNESKDTIRPLSTGDIRSALGTPQTDVRQRRMRRARPEHGIDSNHERCKSEGGSRAPSKDSRASADTRTDGEDEMHNDTSRAGSPTPLRRSGAQKSTRRLRSEPEELRMDLDSLASTEPPQKRDKTIKRKPLSREDQSVVNNDDAVLRKERPLTDWQRRRQRSQRNAIASHSDLISVLSMVDHDRKNLVPAGSIRGDTIQDEPPRVNELMHDLRMDEVKYLRELQTAVDGVIPVLLHSVLSTNGDVAGGLTIASTNKDVAMSTIVNLGIALERLKSAHRRIPTETPESFILWSQTTHRAYEDYLKSWRLGFRDVLVDLAPADFTSSELSSTGEKVNVAYLLKRPLVRIKYLARILKAMSSDKAIPGAEIWAEKYDNLIAAARQRQDDELARLEDEAAAHIDSSRSREPQTLLPLSGVKIDASRCVIARDTFDLKLQHSSGQQLDCRIELFLRDDRGGSPKDGDLLICEMDSDSYWLLFPPIARAQLSSRRGAERDESIVMIRGQGSDGQEWREMLVLRSASQQSVLDWMDMLGSTPVPPKLIRPIRPLSEINVPTRTFDLSKAVSKHFLNSSEDQVPIGEPSRGPAKVWDDKASIRVRPIAASNITSSAFTATTLTSKTDSLSHVSVPKPDDLRSAGGLSPVAANRLAAWLPTQTPKNAESNVYQSRNRYNTSQSAPTTPQGSKDRQSTRSPSPTGSQSSRSSGKHTVWFPGQASNKSRDVGQPETLLRSAHKRGGSYSDYHVGRKEPTPTTHHVSRQSREAVPSLADGKPIPHLSPSPPMAKQQRRRSSSPLKHEYEPSSASETESAMGELLSADEGSITSESSADMDFVGPLPDLKLPKARNASNAPATVRNERNPDTLTPSESASQGPYRSVPKQETAGPPIAAMIYSWSDRGNWMLMHPDECNVTVSPGLIEAHEIPKARLRRGSSSPERPRSSGDLNKPLVALELTPLVPLRRGTAIDISIRSPPTDNSIIRRATNIMFRARDSNDCETLYGMINQARINNPTYMALQNARGPLGNTNSRWGELMERQASTRGRSSWWRRGPLSNMKSSYRAGSSSRDRSLSIAGETESSIATRTSAFSALKRFTNGASGAYNVAKSSITSRGGVSRASTFTGSTGDSLSQQRQRTLDPRFGTPTGMSNAKIRLYQRESASKWRDMGSAVLTILHPPRLQELPPGALEQEKRILVVGKRKGETMLDVTLGEAAFERVARTGIAMSVWEQRVGLNGELGMVDSRGGVLSSKVNVFMIQMGSEAQAAYTFSIVGRLRY